MTSYLSQINLFDTDPYSGPGTYTLGQGGDQSPNTFAALISSSIGLITVIAVIWFVFVFLIGAVGIITSGGDKGSNEAARKKISSGVTGLIVTVLGVLIIRLIGTLIGLTDILNFRTMFDALIIR